jgi:hypothetical protein
MIRCKIAAVAVALSALAAQPAFPQAAIQEPGAFEFYHPNDDVLNAGAPAPAAALASTRAQNAYAAIDDASIATRIVGKRICHREPQVGAFATQPWSSGSPCAPTAGRRFGAGGPWLPTSLRLPEAAAPPLQTRDRWLSHERVHHGAKQHLAWE